MPDLNEVFNEAIRLHTTPFEEIPVTTECFVCGRVIVWQGEDLPPENLVCSTRCELEARYAEMFRE